MKYQFAIVIMLLFFATNLFSQVENRENSNVALADTERYLKTYGKVDLSFSGLGLSVETPLSDRVLLEFAAGAGAGAGYRVNENFKYRMYFDNPSIFTSVHAKYYINKEMRVKKGTSEKFNSGNFFAIKTKYTTPTLHDNKTWHTMLAAFHWGLQRNIGKHVMYQLTIGVGGAIDLDKKTTTHMTVYPDANFRFSYILPF